MTTAHPRPSSVAELVALKGGVLGPTDWYEITQSTIDAFAEATRDFQWIHTDPRRASESPLGSTIAHGLFTLSLGPKFTMELIDFRGFGHSLNYGYDRVRYPAPLPSGSWLRMRLLVAAIEDVKGGVQVTLRQTFERRGAERPVCVADALARFVMP
jgi:acyl dehydratase